MVAERQRAAHLLTDRIIGGCVYFFPIHRTVSYNVVQKFRGSKEREIDTDKRHFKSLGKAKMTAIQTFAAGLDPGRRNVDG
jgi:hypothetical protein